MILLCAKSRILIKFLKYAWRHFITFLSLFHMATLVSEDITGHLEYLITASFGFKFIYEAVTAYCDTYGVCKYFTFPVRCFLLVRRVSVHVSEQVCYFLCLVLPGKAEPSEVPVFLYTLCDTIPRNRQVLIKYSGTAKVNCIVIICFYALQGMLFIGKFCFQIKLMVFQLKKW